MPFELGLFLGCKFSTQALSKRNCLILDQEAYRYRKSLFDLSGRDIRAHRGKASHAILAVRDWLVTASRRTDAPGGDSLVTQLSALQKRSALALRYQKTDEAKLSFWDYREMPKEWLAKV
jgi:hypothetical protein